MKASVPCETDILSLIDGYGALLLDAYGVLVDKTGPLPGALALIEHLNRVEMPYYILTNSASRLPETLGQEFQAMGLAISPARILTSGLLLQTYFAQNGLQGQGCIVLGTEHSKQYVCMAGGEVLSADAGSDATVVVVADQAGFPLLETMDAVLSVLLRRLDAGQLTHLLLCNPDLIYPRAPGRFGFTAGGLAAMIEAVLLERYPQHQFGFVRLGKPYRPIFEEAVRRSGTRDMVMIGDQLVTDILGARRTGLDSALLQTGLARVVDGTWSGGIVPTYVLPTLSMDR